MSTHAQVSLLFEMEDLGRVTLKGFSAPQQVWRALRQTTLSGRSEALFASAPAPIVGRTEELDFLLRPVAADPRRGWSRGADLRRARDRQVATARRTGGATGQ